MKNDQIIRILREAALQLNHDVDTTALRFVEINNRFYTPEEFQEFKRDLIEAGSKVKMLFLEYQLSADAFVDFLSKEESPVLCYLKDDNDLIPVLHHQKKFIAIKQNGLEEISNPKNYLTNEKGEIEFFVIMVYKTMVSEFNFSDNPLPPLSPMKRLLRMLDTERKEIFYILFYAVIIGLVGLILPIGIQNTIELISGGVFFSSVYVLITLVIVGVLAAGGLQIMQISLVEHLQRRIFAKASLEFAFRIPRIKIESLFGNYAPELVNRFFDVMTIQKGLPKLLIDLSTAVFQIFFGLLLLSLYHPFFVFFSLALISILTLIFYGTGPKGLKSSINESKYKYKVAHWLEELARAMNSFKLAGNTDLPIKRTDYNVNNYLNYRKTHFAVLISQFSFIIIFKAAITGGLLIVGTILVVDRQITLGQFVAAEVIIILILNSVEKIIMYLDVLYDLLTAVDKVAQVTDLPLERSGGVDFPKQPNRGYSIEVKNLRYKYPDHGAYTLNGIDLKINAGERVCISGPGSSGKTTLTNILAGLHLNYEGIVTINNYSIRDLDLTHLRDKIAKNISPEDIFDGTILENVTIGKPTETVDDAIRALQKVGAADRVNSLPAGLNTHLLSGGKGLSSSFLHRLILARCLAKNPSLIILNDFFGNLRKAAKVELIQCLVSKDSTWTLVAVSNDPLVMASCDRIVVLNEGRIEASGSYQELLQNGLITKYIE